MYNIKKALTEYARARSEFAVTPDGEGGDDLWATVQGIACEIADALVQMERPQVIEGGVVIEVRGGIVRAVHGAADGTRVAAEVHDYDVFDQDDQDLERDDDGDLYILTAP